MNTTQRDDPRTERTRVRHRRALRLTFVALAVMVSAYLAHLASLTWIARGLGVIGCLVLTISFGQVIIESIEGFKISRGKYD